MRLQTFNRRCNPVSKGLADKGGQKQAHQRQHGKYNLQMRKCGKYEITGNRNAHKPAGFRHRRIGKQLVLPINGYFKITFFILEHFIKMTAQTANFLEILHRLTGTGGGQNITIRFSDDACTFTMIFHGIDLFRQYIQTNIYAGSTDELTIGFDRRSYRYHQLIGIGINIGFGKYRLVTGFGILIPGTLARVFLARVFPGIVTGEPAILSPCSHFQNFFIGNRRAQGFLRVHDFHIAVQAGHMVRRRYAKSFFLFEPPVQLIGLTGNRSPQFAVHAFPQR